MAQEASAISDQARESGEGYKPDFGGHGSRENPSVPINPVAAAGGPSSTPPSVDFAPSRSHNGRDMKAMDEVPSAQSSEPAPAVQPQTPQAAPAPATAPEAPSAPAQPPVAPQAQEVAAQQTQQPSTPPQASSDVIALNTRMDAIEGALGSIAKAVEAIAASQNTVTTPAQQFGVRPGQENKPMTFAKINKYVETEEDRALSDDDWVLKHFLLRDLSIEQMAAALREETSDTINRLAARGIQFPEGAVIYPKQ